MTETVPKVCDAILVHIANMHAASDWLADHPELAGDASIYRAGRHYIDRDEFDRALAAVLADNRGRAVTAEDTGDYYVVSLHFGDYRVAIQRPSDRVSPKVEVLVPAVGA